MSRKIEILKQMIRIRLAEQYIAKRYPEQKMRCPTHLCIGQEAAPAVFGTLAEKNDIFVGTYRSHGHYLAKGGDLHDLFAEILGSAEGCSNGYGGSMHIIDQGVNLYGTSAIVAGGVPIATGAAYALKYKNQSQVVVCFFGDGAVEEGAVYESVNFAVLHNLPIIYVCENNQLAVTTPLELRTKSKKLFERFSAMGLAGFQVKDFEIEELISIAEKVYERGRSGRGPAFVEIAEVKRWALHVGHEYSKMSPCPIDQLTRSLVDSGQITPGEIESYKNKTAKEIEDAFELASSKLPAADFDFENRVYASGLLSELPGGASGGKTEITPTGFKHREPSKLVNPF